MNEPGSRSTVLPSKIIHLVPPPPQVQVKQNYLDLSLTRHAPRVFHHLTSPPPWRISKSPSRRVPVSPANKIFLNKLVKTFPVFLHVGQSS
ncbi:hypothetical protein AMECASPLE_007245 [Ameca splendens]|uniref:Uncharacterized protein n=1 Tax=Ameca splendens TaxID=208324 RepID=A0ABV0YLS4_9TELE